MNGSQGEEIEKKAEANVPTTCYFPPRGGEKETRLAAPTLSLLKKEMKHNTINPQPTGKNKREGGGSGDKGLGQQIV